MSSEKKNSMQFIRYPIGALVERERTNQPIEGSDIQETPISLFLCRPYSQSELRTEKNVCDRRYV